MDWLDLEHKSMPIYIGFGSLVSFLFLYYLYKIFYNILIRKKGISYVEIK